MAGRLISRPLGVEPSCLQGGGHPMDTPEATTSPRSSRPLGVWLLIAYAVIFEGLSPATAMAIFILGFLRSAPPPSESLPLYLLLVRLLTNLGVVVAAILAFSGRSIGRWSLPVLVAVNHLLAMPI